jgi:AraC-like DNA-binding protein
VLARPISANAEALRLLVGYVHLTLKNRQPASPELSRLFVSHVHDLVALAVGATRDAGEIAYRRGMRAARLRAAKAFIARHIDRNDLSVSDVATHLGVTQRYVHMLFETEDASFTTFIVRQRLALAHRLLADPRMTGHTISAIAFQAGFNDLSHFNRVFRRQFGLTPSAMRRTDGR